MLHIQNISVSVGVGSDNLKSILHNCSLQVKPGQIHIVMGPNGSGKSSLLYTLMGHQAYQVTAGTISFYNQNMLDVPVHVRSQQGFFLSMQQPEAIFGLQVLLFLKEVWTIHTKNKIALQDFLEIVHPLLSQAGLTQAMLYRSVHDGFSGGEKKRFELLLMMLLRPKICMLDEIDSGVDIDGLKLLATGLQKYVQQNPDSSIIMVTHYRHILDYIKPDVVHIMVAGSIVATGSSDLIDLIEQKGYEQYAKRIE